MSKWRFALYATGMAEYSTYCHSVKLLFLNYGLYMAENSKRGVVFEEVESDYEGQRLDNFLITRIKGAPKSLIYRIIRKGEVRVNKGRSKPDYKIQTGDIVRIPPVRLKEADEPANVSANMAQGMEKPSYLKMTI